MDDLLVLCKIAGAKEAHAPEKDKEKSSVGYSLRLSTHINDWEDFNWGSPWPTNK